jgi:glycogen(starch) synthase
LMPSAFHPSLGGVEELTRQLAHSLRDAGHNVILITNRWPHALPAHETFEGLPLFRLPFYSPIGSLRAALTYPIKSRVTHQAITDILVQHDIQLLHLQCISTNALYAARAAKTLHLPLIVSLQGELTMDASHLYQRSHLARRMYQQTLAAADLLTACSADTLAEAESFFGRPFGLRGSVIPNGIRLADFANITPHSHPRPYFLAIGRHVPQKGFDTLLQAYANALTKNPNLSHDLLLAGDGPSNADLQNLAKSLNLTNRVHFLGRTDRPKTAALFAGCDFFILPSRHEPQGIVNLEAMAAGKPVIATNVGGVPEIVHHNHNGLLVPPENPETLAAAMLILAADTALRTRLGNQALATAKSHDWPQITNRYLALYTQLVPANHPDLFADNVSAQTSQTITRNQSTRLSPSLKASRRSTNPWHR